MKVIQSAHHKAIRGMPLADQESLILPEIYELTAANLTVTDYMPRARAIYNLLKSDGFMFGSVVN